MPIVTFVTNGGTQVDPITVTSGSLIVKPDDPVKVSYSFVRWYKDEALTETWNFASDTVQDDLVLYAKWRLYFIEKIKTVLKSIRQEISQRIEKTEKGAANGVATLDENSKIPIEQVNDAFDEVRQFQTKQDFPVTGEAGKVYIEATTSRLYRWNGTEYVATSANQTYLAYTRPDDMLKGDIWFHRK